MEISSREDREVSEVIFICFTAARLSFYGIKSS
jgi:hypothetical protein